jgi:hypothetical protein
MKVNKLALLAAVACGMSVTSAMAQQPGYGKRSGNVASSRQIIDSQVTPVGCECEASGEGCGCEAAGDASCGCEATCDNSCDSMSCDGAGCGTGLTGGLGLGGLGLGGMFTGIGLGDGCCHDEPFELFGEYCGIKVGGWSAVGYHTASEVSNFNNYADRVQLSQQWLYAEDVADGSNGLDFGGRVDYLYGTDAPDTQAFGINNDHWDNDWTNGEAYGQALPQAYGEVAYGDTSVKVGKFFTIVGNEVVQATGNFFYSRQFTFYNSEPFTHTGALATTQLSDDVSVWNGYVMGWDSGFEDNGDAYIGGMKAQLTDETSFIYTTVLGRFGETKSPFFTERGQIHSFILTTSLTDRLTHILQADYLNTDIDFGGDTFVARNTFGLINYFIYSINDCWSIGSRSEWYNRSSDDLLRNADMYNQTVGLNYKPTANITIRPEARWIWDKEKTGLYTEVSPNDGLPLPSQASFGMDMIFTF